MPVVNCEVWKCKFNVEDKCTAEEIELTDDEYNMGCATYEWESREVNK